MSWSFEDPETRALAAKVASLTGETIADAVTIALRERLARLENLDAETDAVLALGRECASRMSEYARNLDPASLLYDDRGLPK